MRIEATIESRYIQLVAKEQKDGRDYKEIDLLGRQLERCARIQKYLNGGNETDLNPKVANRNKGIKKIPRRNEFSPEQTETLIQAFNEWMFPYQREWWNAGLQNRIRNILASRRIGKTRYFAREALIRALKFGRSQIWLSASKAQAYEAKIAIQDFARNAADVELRGDPIVLPAHCSLQKTDESPTLYFLGNNYLTAQGYGGDVIQDEYMWVYSFSKLRKVASAMAAHKKYTKTYISTPAAQSSEAYQFWSGDYYNKGRLKDQRINLDISHAALKNGRLCEDKQWRQIVTIHDAIEAGCELFDIDELQVEYSVEEFAQLFLCQFIDDGASVFTFPVIQRCMIDSWVEWEGDFKPFTDRPLGNREVWVGYDPADSGDSAALVVVAPPLVASGKFRVLEKQQFRGLDYQEQAQAIRKIGDRYNISFIGIDTTGLGSAVYQLVSKWFPAVTSYSYSADVKTRMVLKTLSVMQKGRLEFDAGWTDVAAAFMAIKKTMTASGQRVTFEAGRSESISHADLAWAIMHTLANEPLDEMQSVNTGGFMEIY